MGIDIIGDVHGHGERLEALLARLGYKRGLGAWRHQDRTAIFVGDLIDRGPQQRQTLRLVRAMVDGGAAQACLGNHELNAIAYATGDPAAPGRFLRSRDGAAGAKHAHQHAAFLGEVGLDSLEHREWVAWFLERPLWIERRDFRVVHACWSPSHIGFLEPNLRPDARLTPELTVAGARHGTATHRALETVLKGCEVPLPEGAAYHDKDGTVRTAMRTRWWDEKATTYRSAYIGPDGPTLPDLPIETDWTCPPLDRATFIGHYWLSPTRFPKPLGSQLACVDFSAAAGGPLVAYRFDGERVLTADKFVAV